MGNPASGEVWSLPTTEKEKRKVRQAPWYFRWYHSKTCSIISKSDGILVISAKKSTFSHIRHNSRKICRQLLSITHQKVNWSPNLHSLASLAIFNGQRTLFFKCLTHENQPDFLKSLGHRPQPQVILTMGWGQWPGVTGRTGRNQCALLLEKSVTNKKIFTFLIRIILGTVS